MTRRDPRAAATRATARRARIESCGGRRSIEGSPVDTPGTAALAASAPRVGSEWVGGRGHTAILELAHALPLVGYAHRAA